MIREGILAGTVVYIVITLLQVIAVETVMVEGLIFGIAMASVTAFFWSRDEHTLENVELIALWAGVLLFLTYALAKMGGWA